MRAPVACSAPCNLMGCEPAPRVLQDSMADLQPRVTLCHRRLLRVCGGALQRRRPLRACGCSPAAGSLALCGSLQSALRAGSPRDTLLYSDLQPRALRMSGLLHYLAQKLWCFCARAIGVASSSRWLLPLSTGSSGLSVLLVSQSQSSHSKHPHKRPACSVPNLQGQHCLDASK